MGVGMLEHDQAREDGGVRGIVDAVAARNRPPEDRTELGADHLNAHEAELMRVHDLRESVQNVAPPPWLSLPVSQG